MSEVVNIPGKKMKGVDIFIARQPIFDRQTKVFAYELLYRSDLHNRANISSDEYATMKVIANSLLIGLQKLTGDRRAFINFNRKLLLGQVPMMFSKDALGVEILGSVDPDEYVLRVCKRITRLGYQLIMDSFSLHEDYQQLLEMASIIKIDFRTTNAQQRKMIIRRINHHAPNAEFLAMKVETRAEYDEALETGFEYFQGFFFQEPALISRQEMPGYKLHYLSILKKIHEPVFDLKGIEEIIKRDVSLTYKLLRFINSAAHGFKVTIRSIHHALILLGKRELRRWLSIIVMSGIGTNKPPELMKVTVIRARFCELIADEFGFRESPSDYFLMGMLSLVDAFLDRPLEEILAELPVEENIKKALLTREGGAHGILQLVEHFEKAQWEEFGRMANDLGLDGSKIALLYLDAVEWSKFLTED